MKNFPTHADICEMFDVPVTLPAPNWTPYAVKKTVIEVIVNGVRRAVFGGAMECGACGFGISMLPDENTTPPARSDGGCPKCGALTRRKP